MSSQSYYQPPAQTFLWFVTHSSPTNVGGGRTDSVTSPKSVSIGGYPIIWSRSEGNTFYEGHKSQKPPLSPASERKQSAGYISSKSPIIFVTRKVVDRYIGQSTLPALNIAQATFILNLTFKSPARHQSFYRIQHYFIVEMFPIITTKLRKLAYKNV